ncbi:zinc finger protein 831 [Pseudophryne corroboree]|uniref:zinc finger protein 831 n=1 Tax=Pseudophryne corroboree TaxID=495146 RepID=UPI0030814E51
MDTSHVSVLSSSLAWPTSTSTGLPSSHNNKQSTAGTTPPEAVVLKGVSLPIYQFTPQEGQQTPFQLISNGTSFAIDNNNLSVMFTPQSQTILQKSPMQTLTLNIMNTLPILYPNCSTSLNGASPGKAKNIGKHICIHCGRDCLKPSVLEKHIRSHTGERPFPCTVCGISFKTQSNLYKHRRTQSHVNNTKQSFHSDCDSCHEDTPTGQVGDNSCLNIRNEIGDVCIDKEQHTKIKNIDNVISVQNNVSGNKEIVFRPLTLKIHEKTHDDPDHSSPDTLNQQITPKDQISTTTSRHAELQWQHETCVDKQWAFSSSDRKLKKCESTDSGYLSHSDSADLQMVSGSPLQSLSESSIEYEHMLSVGAGDSEDKPASVKKNLGEHISMLISQNKAVVDNTHLDNVRPRKTALSKQGSIDLPMPYTFKDSFHFDIKSFDVNRRKVSLSSAKSTFNLPEKNKPLCFHSVPTQASTTFDSAIFARSNSLPFVESSRLLDKLTIHNTKKHCMGKQLLNGNNANVLLSNTATACIVDLSRSHPRGLVRQAAVDEMQVSNACECSISQEIKEKKKPSVDPFLSKSKSANKKGTQKKLNMFCHEKWQMYGDENFKKFYQKIKKNEHARKTDQDIPESRGVVSHQNVLQAACGMAKPSESIVTLSQVTSQATSITLHTPTTNVQNELGFTQVSGTILSSGSLSDTSGKVSKLENLASIDSPSAQMDPHLQSSPQLPCIRDSDSGVITVTEKQSKIPHVSNIHCSMEACCIGSFQNSEKLSFDNTAKMAEVKDESTKLSTEHTNTAEPNRVSSLLNINSALKLTGNVDTLQNKNVDYNRDIDNTARNILDGASTISCSSSLFTFLNENILPSLSNGCEKTTAHFSKQLALLPTQSSSSSSSSSQKGNVYCPRYLIKCNYIVKPLEASTVMQTDQTNIYDMSNVDNNLSLTEDKHSDSVLPSQAETCHENGLANQVKLTQKHGSEALTGNISLNTECVLTCASKISIDLGQKVILDTQESGEQNINFDNIYPNRHKIQEHTSAPTIYYKDCLLSELHCRDTNQDKKESNTLIHKLLSPGQKSEGKPCLKHDTATSAICSAQDSKMLLTDTFPTGLFSLNPGDPMSFQDEKSLCSTAHLCLQSGICNISVTKVAFSALNTEPKSTWCWLDRCLPLPAEQKEKSFSVYASLSCNAIKNKRPIPGLFSQARSNDKDFPDSTTEQNLKSSLLWSSTAQKAGLEEITEATIGKLQPLAKRSSKMGAQTKSRQVKRSKDRACGSTHSKVSQPMTKRSLRQDQRHNKICCPSHLQSGDIFQWTDTSKYKDKGDTITMNPLTGDNGEKQRECKDGMESQVNESTISIPASPLLSDDSGLLISSKNKHSSQPTEGTAHLELHLASPLNWQKFGCNLLQCNLPIGSENTFEQATSEVKRVHLQQDLRDSPPQKHGRKILQRSKTIGHGLTVGQNHSITLHSSISSQPCAEPLLGAAVGSRDKACIPSLQNSMEFAGGVCGYIDRNLSTINSGEPLEPGALSLNSNLLSEDHHLQSLKSQKKLNLEVMRKQTHVECSDTSSDDEDRLYIEI